MKKPPRQASLTLYEFSIAGGMLLSTQPETLDPPKAQYKIGALKFEVYNSRTAHIEIWGNFLTNDPASRERIRAKLQLAGEERCSHRAHALVYVPGSVGYQYSSTWKPGYDFVLVMTSANLNSKRRADLDTGIWKLYEGLARELDFSDVRPTVDIYHTFLLHVNKSLVPEGLHFVRSFYKPQPA